MSHALCQPINQEFFSGKNYTELHRLEIKFPQSSIGTRLIILNYSLTLNLIPWLMVEPIITHTIFLC